MVKKLWGKIQRKNKLSNFSLAIKHYKVAIMYFILVEENFDKYIFSLKNR